MTLATQPVNDFVQDSYQLVSANSPTVPLQGNDLQKGIQFLNELIKYYSSSSLLLPIAQKITFNVAIGQQFVTFGDPTFVPTPDVTVGRLSNLQRAWLNLDGVDYPLIDESRSVFFGSYKFEPQQGLPRFVIITNDLNLTTMQLYPSPSQVYTLFVYGKFEPPIVVSGGKMSNFSLYYIRFLKFALARELAFYKGRSSAWDAKLEAMYTEAEDAIKNVSAMDLVIDSANESYLNGSWRLRAGV
jgi:hypothetical protein